MAKKQITINIKIGELVYDIANKTYLQNRLDDSGDNFLAAANAQTDDLPECENELLRNITTCIGVLYNELANYINSDLEATNNAIMDKKDMTVTLLVPMNFNSAALQHLTNVIHDYVVNYTIGLWYMKTNQKESELYITASNGILPLIIKAISKRRRPARGEQYK